MLPSTFHSGDEAFFKERLEMFMQKNLSDISDFAEREGLGRDFNSVCTLFHKLNEVRIRSIPQCDRPVHALIAKNAGANTK